MVETVLAEGETKTSFLKDICAYFRDFLDTDFKRQSAPKRSVTLKDASGNLTGIDASKYPDLVNEVWQLLRKSIGDNPASRSPCLADVFASGSRRRSRT